MNEWLQTGVAEVGGAGDAGDVPVDLQTDWNRSSTSCSDVLEISWRVRPRGFAFAEKFTPRCLLTFIMPTVAFCRSFAKGVHKGCDKPVSSSRHRHSFDRRRCGGRDLPQAEHDLFFFYFF